jgi:hypothetical protein
MPFVNGRFYMNPIFGAALERARKANAGKVWSEKSPEPALQRVSGSKSSARQRPTHAAKPSSAAHKKHNGDDYDPATTTAGVANQICNETAGLRPTTHQGPGSDVDLQDARRAIGHVIHNRAVTRTVGGLASPELRSKEDIAIKAPYLPAYDAYGGSRAAAQVSNSKRDPTGGAKLFYLDHGQRAPYWTNGKRPVAVYGPFENTTPPQGVRKGNLTRIKIY